MSSKLSDKTRRQIFGIARKLGISDGTENDELHNIIYRVTGKPSVKELTEGEAVNAVNALKEYLKLSELEKNAPPEFKDRSSYYEGKARSLGDENTGSCEALISDAQISFICGKMYKLVSYDDTPSEIPYRKRLAGIISKVTGSSVSPAGDMFKGLTEAQGAAIIETLKRYIRTAENKRKRKEIT